MTQSLQLIRNEIIDRLEDLIQERQLAAGTRLPSERELCGLWGCNRVTLRAAIRKLVDAGRLRSVHGSGTYLEAPRVERNLWQFNSFGETFRSGGHAVATRSVAFARLEAPKRIAEALEVPLGTPVWRVERLRLVDGLPMALETAWIPLRLAPTLDRIDLERESLYATLEARFGVRLRRAVDELSVVPARPAAAALLQVPEGADLLVLEGTAYDQDDRPAEFSSSLTRGDRCRFTMRVGRGARAPEPPGPASGTAIRRSRPARPEAR